MPRWQFWKKVERENPAWPVILRELSSWSEQQGIPPYDQDFTEYLKATKFFPLVMACVGKIKTAAADVPWFSVNRRTGDRIDDQKSKASELFSGSKPATPNELDGPRSFREQAFQQRAMFGELYLVLDGPSPIKPQSIHVLRSASTAPILGRRGEPQIVAYEYGRRVGTPVRIEPEWVIFNRDPHPADPVRGLSPIGVLENTLKVLLPWYGLHSSTVKNGAKLGGLLVLKGSRRTTPEGRSELGKEVDRRFGGDNAGKTMVLEAEDAQWFQLGQTARDMEFSALYDIIRREIFNVFGVPPGLFDSKDVNRSNMEEQRALLYTDVVRPMVNSLLDDINRHPFMLAIGERLQADWEQVEALQPNLLEESKALQSLVGHPVMTRNEARSRLGLPPVEGGDEFAQPQQRPGIMPSLEEAMSNGGEE